MKKIILIFICILGSFNNCFLTIPGPTSCGKTSWIKKLLENSANYITPPPIKIVYCYKRWQPLYDDIIKRVSSVEFIQGIPRDINDDHFLDKNYPTLIILDDQMRDSAQSGDICELFTEGSHHRNLSVICLMQNMFFQGKESRTMSLNTQYMVLFKSPRDKQQIAVLARQMYPTRAKYFIERYEKATRVAHGYLFVDLKQSTDENDRLIQDIFNDQRPLNSAYPDYSAHAQNSAITDKYNANGRGIGRDTGMSNDEPRNEPETPVDRSEIQPPPGLPEISTQQGRGHQSYNTPVSYHSSHSDVRRHSDYVVEGMDSSSCADCGCLYASSADLYKHIKRGCPEDDDHCQLPNKRYRMTPSWEEEGSKDVDDDDDDDVDAEEVGFRTLINDTYKAFDDEYERLMKENEDKGELASRRMASSQLRPQYKKNVMGQYKMMTKVMRLLEDSPVDIEIKKRIHKYQNKGYDYETAVDRAVKDKKFLFDRLLDMGDEPEQEARDSD